MSEIGCSPGRLAIWIRNNKGISLSTQQVRNLVYIRNTERDMHVETIELENYMASIGGKSFVMEEEREGKTVRTAIATFTRPELENLADFGDLVAIDPTFTPLTLNWNVIPITVVGKGREIRSGGIVMSLSTVGNMFHWILTLLTDVLPCREKIRSIVSDEDKGLSSAFDSSENPRISSLGRIVCFWHKMQKFNGLVKRWRLNGDAMHEKIETFRRIGMTRNIDECNRCIDVLLDQSPSFTQQFIRESIIPVLPLCTKSHNTAWSLGYITSSITEEANSRFKSHLTGRNHSLIDLRQFAIDMENQLRVDAQYLKASKRFKERDTQVGDFMNRLNVHRRIAESLVGSYNKALSLKVEAVDGDDLFQVTEENSFGDLSRYLINTHFESCSCRKKETVGIPCAHLISVMIHLNVMNKLIYQIHPRWQMADDQHQDFESTSLTEPMTHEGLAKSMTPQQRYSRLNGMCQSIASLGGRSKKAYEMVMNDLEELLKRLTRPNSTEDVVDAIGIRCGRPARNRIRVNTKRNRKPPDRSNDDSESGQKGIFQICDDDHKAKHCPYREDLKRFIRSKDGKPGGKGCSACHLSGHYISRCPAIRRFREAQLEEANSEFTVQASGSENSYESGETGSSWDSDDIEKP
jgi:hypothetical protein